MTPRRLALHRIALLAATFCLNACVFKIPIQQGNLLDQDKIDQVEVGMTRKQVQFLLGTPMVSDTFHRDRWDYAYYLKLGRSEDVERRWFVVYFDGDRVTRFDRVEMQPAS
ncbi:MAG TPA: outer membrane protein assembly factor BamE [Gammaproteobacteria bacterium]|nr:outer membrane protein assembly factor BamE [Gammaproteobacteria bacterium]